MIVNIQHTDIKKIPFKKSDILYLTGTISQAIYTIMRGMGIEEQGKLLPFYTVSVVTKTGATIMSRWEENEEREKNKKRQKYNY